MTISLVLPLLASVSAGAPVETQARSHAELEALVGDGVRAAVAAGWRLVAIEGDDTGLTFTVVAGGAAQRHVAIVDERMEGGVYRVERGAAPADPGGVTDAALAAAAAPAGGFEILPACGDFYERAYVVEAAARGAAAGELASATLAAADDLEDALPEGDTVTLALERDGAPVDLVLTRGADDRLAAAEVRRYDYRGDASTYAGMSAFRTLPPLTRLETDGADHLVLVAGRRRIPIDPDHFAPHPDLEHDGCGC